MNRISLFPLRQFLLLFLAWLPASVLFAQMEEEVPATVPVFMDGADMELNGVTTTGASTLVNLKAWKTYVLTVNSGTAVLYPPTGHTLYINGVEARTPQSPWGPYDIQVRPRSFLAPAGIGEATSLQFPILVWGVSLGNQLSGKPAGHLFFNEATLTNGSYTPDALMLTAESSDVEIINSGQALRQVKGPQGLADIVTTGSFSYEIRFYRPQDVGTRSPPSSPYSVSGTPFVTYSIQRAVSGSNSGIKIIKTVGSRTETTIADTISGGWRLTCNGGDRIEEKTSISSGGTTYQQHVIKNAANTTASLTWRRYQTFDWGDRIIQKIENPYGGANAVTTNIAYTPSSAAGTGNVASVSYGDGHFVRYDYSSDSEKYGQLWREIRPIKNSPSTLSGIVTSPANCAITTYDYAADWTGRKTLPCSVECTYPLRKQPSSTTTNTTANTQPLNATTTTAYWDATQYITSSVKYFRRHMWDTVYVDLPYCLVSPDGRKASYVYHTGNYNVSTKTFTKDSDQPGTGRCWREVVLYGWADVVSGYTTEGFSTLDGQTLDTVRLIANKSIKTVTIRDTRANVVRTERYIFTGSTNFELLDSADYTYDDACHLTSITKSNGEVSEIEWTYGRKTAEVDPTGIRTEYVYDDLGRVTSITKKGIAADGGFPAQGDIVTSYTYDAVGHVLSETVTGGSLTFTTTRQYDLAGRLTQTVEPGGTSGVQTTYSYSNGGRTQTATFADGATKIIDRYLDRLPGSVTGTAVVSEYYDYAEDYEKVFHGSSTSGFYSKTMYDKLGRKTQEKPNPNFQRDWAYDGVGRVAQSPAGPTSVYHAYNALGEPWRLGGSQSNLLTPGSTTAMMSEAEHSFVKDGSDWWQVETSKVYSTPNSSTLVTTGSEKRRLTGFATGVLSETKVVDLDGNVTTKTIEVDRSAKKHVMRVVSPDSSVSEEVTSINGLTLQRRTRENLTYGKRYDALGRLVEEIDPRTGSSYTAYESGSSRVVSRTDAAGKVTAYTAFDALGRVTTEKNPANKYTYRAYTSRGELWRVWGDVPYPVEYVYDSLGHKSQMKTYRGGSGWTSSTWPSSPGTADVTTWAYDSTTGLLTSKTTPAGDVVSYNFDPSGILTSFTNARSKVISYSSYFYNPFAGTAEWTSRTSSYQVWNDETESYDTITDLSSSRSFNRLGQLSSASESNGTTSFAYDLSTTLRLQTETLPSLQGSKVLTRKYATSGVVGRANGFQLGTSGTPAAEEDITYGYDTYGRLSTIESNFGNGAFDKTTTYAYTANSNLLASIATPTSGTDVFAMARLYEANRDLITTTSAALNTTAVKAAYTYAYDDLGRRTSVIQTGEMFAGYENDSDPGLVEKYTYNDRSELTAANSFVGNTTASTTALPGRDYGYAYDPIGNRTSTTTNGRSALSYTSNSNNQYTARAVAGTLDVSGVADTTGTVTVNGTALTSGERSYWYYSHATSFTPTTAPLYAGITVSYGSTTETAAKLLAMPSESMTYDADGNLTADGQWDYTWDVLNRLTKMETRSAAVAIGVPKQKLEFVYDCQDRRVQKKVYAWVSGAWSTTSDVRFIYDGWNVVAEYDANASAVTRRYAWGIDFSGTVQGAGGVGGLLVSSLKDSGGTWRTYYAAHDGSGNVTALVNATSGSLVAAYEYDPFGRTLRASVDPTLGSAEQAVLVAQPWRFSTKFTDAETGLVYYGKRYYSPSQGRFLGRDRKQEKGGLNLYAFCQNDGINYWDYLGMDRFMIITIGSNGLAQWEEGDGLVTPGGLFSGRDAWDSWWPNWGIPGVPLTLDPMAILRRDAQAGITVTAPRVTGPVLNETVASRLRNDPVLQQIYDTTDFYDVDLKNGDGKNNRSILAGYIRGTSSVVVLNSNADIPGIMNELGYKGSVDDFSTLTIAHELFHASHQADPSLVPSGYTGVQAEALARKQADDWARANGIAPLYGGHSSIDDYTSVVEDENQKARVQGRPPPYSIAPWTQAPRVTITDPNQIAVAVGGPGSTVLPINKPPSD